MFWGGRTDPNSRPPEAARQSVRHKFSPTKMCLWMDRKTEKSFVHYFSPQRSCAFNGWVADVAKQWGLRMFVAGRLPERKRYFRDGLTFSPREFTGRGKLGA